MENTYREAIRKIVGEYYEQNISADEYRTKRRQLIDQMDYEFNGSKSMLLAQDPSTNVRPK